MDEYKGLSNQKLIELLRELEAERDQAVGELNAQKIVHVFLDAILAIPVPPPQSCHRAAQSDL
jgi:hypothetical protein